jgi:hypothetical protein
MRLRILQDGYGTVEKIQLWLIDRIMGQVPGPVRVTAYRKQFFGAHFARCVHEALHGESEWTRHERELFATFVSHLNKCPY